MSTHARWWTATPRVSWCPVRTFPSRRASIRWISAARWACCFFQLVVIAVGAFVFGLQMFGGRLSSVSGLVPTVLLAMGLAVAATAPRLWRVARLFFNYL